eukprot:3374513-Prymnesium_polylepis.1
MQTKPERIELNQAASLSRRDSGDADAGSLARRVTDEMVPATGTADQQTGHHERSDHDTYDANRGAGHDLGSGVGEHLEGLAAKPRRVVLAQA